MTKARVNADNASADIQGVTAGTGLSGGGTSGTVTLTNDMATTIAAKGDLVVGTGNDTYSALTVGEQGATIVADSSSSVGLRWQPAIATNPIINGGFDVWQRGTSVAYGTVGGFGADRWIVVRGGWASGATMSRQTGTAGIQYAARVQRDSGNTSTNGIYIDSWVETANSVFFQGKTITLSFYARCGANFSASGSAMTLNFLTGTGTDQNGTTTGYTGSVTAISQTSTLTTSWQRFSYSTTLNSNINEMGVSIGYLPTGTAGANDWFEITGVQVDVGSVALPFRRAGGTIQGELAACQRYYWRSTAESSYSRFTEFNSPQSATAMFLTLRNPVRMRVKASSIDYSSLLGYDGSNLLNAVTALTIGGDSTNDWTNLTVTSTGMTQYRPTQLIANNSSSAYLGLSAEL